MAVSTKVSESTRLKVIKYFHMNYQYKEISRIIFSKHKKKVSVRTIKRVVKNAGLKRKNIRESRIEEIVATMWQEIESTVSNLGYRSMRQRLQKEYNLCVKQKTELALLRLMDPEGVERRKRNKLHRRTYSVPGPNLIWHVDGHDKLKKEGFAIHGCIDGFSRKLLHLEVATTNNDPHDIGHMFCETVKKYKCVPTILRSDKRTENIIMADIQQCLRSNHTDDLVNDSYISGKSTANQRIESAWCQLRKHLTDSYMNHFKDLQANNLLDLSNPIHIENLRYCFGCLLQYDLNCYKKEWNEHRIRQQPAREIIGGIPNMKYYVPVDYGARECKKEIDVADVEFLSGKYTKKPSLINEELKNAMNDYFADQWPPSTLDDATKLYLAVKKLLEVNQDSNTLVQS